MNFADRCTRPHQSGQEQKHEAWVLATLNFLQRQDIPFYTRDEFGNRISGGDRDIPERLKLVDRKIADLRRNGSKYLCSFIEEEQKHRSTRKDLSRAMDMLEAIWHRFDDVKLPSEAVDKLESLLRELRPSLFEEETDGES